MPQRQGAHRRLRTFRQHDDPLFEALDDPVEMPDFLLGAGSQCGVGGEAGEKSLVQDPGGGVDAAAGQVALESRRER